MKPPKVSSFHPKIFMKPPKNSKKIMKPGHTQKKKSGFYLKPEFSHWGPNFYPWFLDQKTKNKCWNQAYSNAASTGCNFITNWPLTYPAREGENINIESECRGVKNTFYIVVLYWLVNYLSIHQVSQADFNFFLFFVFDIVAGYSWGRLIIWNLIY